MDLEIVKEISEEWAKKKSNKELRDFLEASKRARLKTYEEGVHFGWRKHFAEIKLAKRKADKEKEILDKALEDIRQTIQSSK